MQGFYKAILVSGAALMLACSAPAFGGKVQSDLAKEKAAQAALAKKSKEIGAEVGELKGKLVTTAKTLRQTEDSIAKNSQRLNDLRARRAENLAGLQADYDALGGLVAAAGKYNRTSTAQMLLLSDPLRAARAATVMKTIIPEVNRHADALKAQIGEMASIEDEITERLGEQSRQLKAAGAQKSELTALLKDRQALYGKTEEQRKAQEKEIARLAKEARNLAELERKLREQEAAHRTARAGKRSNRIAVTASLPSSLLPPVAGPVHTGFGQTDDLGAISEGITYAAPAGAVVVTPLAGSVRFAGPFQKYRQILIIEHRGGYHSLIAGLDRIDTVVGAKLAAGEPVGSAGKAQQDNRIYYELRRGGDPINPRPLMVAQREQDKS